MMKIYDISQEVFSCRIYPGDPKPERQDLCKMESGDLYNLTALSMCTHNGTHIDAPAHFLKDGATVEKMDLDIFVGPCYVARHTGDVTAADAGRILQAAGGAQRLLLAGDLSVTEEAARVFAAADLKLLGNEGQTVGPADAPMQVHLILLRRGIALLEGIVLRQIAQGHYFLSAAPLKLGGCEGAPCRAYLLENELF